jgi:hypothetical protein
MRDHKYKEKLETAAKLRGVRIDTQRASPQGPAALPRDISSWSESYDTPISLTSNFAEPHHGVLAVQPPTLVLHSSPAPPFRSHLISASRVTGYENTKEHENLTFCILVDKIAQYSQVDYRVDAFTVLPAFDHPDLDSVDLIRKCRYPFANCHLCSGTVLCCSIIV